MSTLVECRDRNIGVWSKERGRWGGRNLTVTIVMVAAAMMVGFTRAYL